MEDKEIILSQIAELLSKDKLLYKKNGDFKARLKCIGLKEYYERYSDYLEPYYYSTNRGYENENKRLEYNVFLGLDGIFEDLYTEEKHEAILLFLKELTKSFNIYYIENYLNDDFNLLKNLYQILGLDISIEEEKVKVTAYTNSSSTIVSELFTVEAWLKTNFNEVYESYDAAISAYVNGHPGLCIEGCRTTIVSILERFKGTEKFAKWIRGIYNITENKDDEKNVNELKTELEKLNKNDLAKFLNENINGKFTKTKAIYSIYSMMSDYGTHRNEKTKEIPTQKDALFMLRLTDSILFWIYSIINEL